MSTTTTTAAMADPSQAQLNMLDHLSKAVFNNSHFVQILGNAGGTSPSVESTCFSCSSHSQNLTIFIYYLASFTKIADAVKKDSDLNRYQPGSNTVNVPHITFDIVSLLPPGEAGVARSSPSSHGSSAFDLAQRLSLLPHQEYGVLLPMIPVDLEKVPRYNERYCGYLSRHALVYLASQYAGRATTVGNYTVLDTTIGRFKIFEHEHRTHVYFDPGMRAASPSKPYFGTPDLDVLKKYAAGQYLVKEVVVDIDTIPQAAMTWTRQDLTKFATTKIIQPPEHRVFVPKETMAEWNRLEKYSADLRQATASIFGSMTEPHRLARFRDNLIENQKRKDNSLKTEARLPDELYEHKVAVSAYVSFITVGTPERVAIVSEMDPSSTFAPVLRLHPIPTNSCAYRYPRGLLEGTGCVQRSPRKVPWREGCRPN
jgi:hypothetical protein